MPSRPEDRPRVREVFEAALAFPSDARRSHVAKTCGGDDSLRQQVELLLDSHERAKSAGETQPAVSLDTTAAAPRNLEGHRIGPYQIASRLGAGGMGEVYQRPTISTSSSPAIASRRRSWP
jgi:eukaryotic-like serine/threonine-protein kinase